MEEEEKIAYHRTNGGQACDVDEGPCACGAWHYPQDIRSDQLLYPLAEIARLRRLLHA